MAGFFEGWTGERLEIWEREQVEEMHELYDAEFPNGDPARVTRAAGKTGKPAPKSGPIGAVQKERARCAGVVRDVAAQPGVKDFEHALLMQAAERIEGGGESERF